MPPIRQELPVRSPPPTLGVSPAKNEKAKGTDHSMTTEAQRDRQDWYNWCRDQSPPGRASSEGSSKHKTGDDSRKGRIGRHPPQGFTRDESAESETPRAHTRRGEERRKVLGRPQENGSLGYIPRQEWDQKLHTEKGATEICETAEASTSVQSRFHHNKDMNNTNNRITVAPSYN